MWKWNICQKIHEDKNKNFYQSQIETAVSNSIGVKLNVVSNKKDKIFFIFQFETTDINVNGVAIPNSISNANRETIEVCSVCDMRIPVWKRSRSHNYGVICCIPCAVSFVFCQLFSI